MSDRIYATGSLERSRQLFNLMRNGILTAVRATLFMAIETLLGGLFSAYPTTEQRVELSGPCMVPGGTR